MKDAKENELTTFGSIAGFDIRVMKAGDGYAGYLVGENSYKFSVNLSNPTMMFTSMSAVLKNLEKDLEQHRAALDKAGKDIEELKSLWHEGVRFLPNMSEERRNALVVLILVEVQRRADVNICFVVGDHVEHRTAVLHAEDGRRGAGA